MYILGHLAARSHPVTLEHFQVCRVLLVPSQGLYEKGEGNPPPGLEVLAIQ